jgi:hypothetical protein
MKGKTMTDTYSAIITEILEGSCEGLAWDSCHKIYILRDREQVNRTKELNRLNPDSYIIVEADDADPKKMYKILWDWFQESCFLRFISTIDTSDYGENIFDTVIPQGAEW